MPQPHCDVSPPLEIIRSAITSGHSADQILEKLDELNIERWITERGDLMIKYWQVAAEGFVSAGQVAQLRSEKPAPAECDALEWVSNHLTELQAQYTGKWIGVADGRVVASADSLPELSVTLDSTEVDSPLVTQIPADPVVWRTIYGNQNL
jgi:hypothetical protein